ncbi:hypothetical protein E3Q23_03429 [Wallemia mellicola]|uniref:Uncharacterized protein n=1 Tax=Wallemia mellicola TaxID=1708541 RepID=A0A4T0TDB2_9BASI|nr:hypothetical protein E3Q23_03429 [Wallemia mellicola]TIB87910.1 hypothetical protein E3Q19_03453 [Wallemia mellicola]TIC63375.1 hypothetical protein E3Q01_03391 [Wallemia mellicola]TIC73079.1 hypothetical protein E3Q00_03309 [Wallemia mellicola]
MEREKFNNPKISRVFKRPSFLQIHSESIYLITMGQSKFKPRQTMSRINKPAPIKHSGDNNLHPVDHRRSGLSRPKRCSWCIERGSE